jgi:3-hydroxybutyryl-CoA dehydrogenase
LVNGAVLYRVDWRVNQTVETLNEQLGIAGSGAIACGLAVTAAGRGEVVMWARSEESADRARGEVEAGCGKSDNGALPANVRVETDPQALADATFVVESVAEDLEVKARVLRELGGLVGPDAILATTTSALPVAELARTSGRPERFAAVHVFNPVPRMELVELCFPSHADDETRRRTRALCEALGKKAVEVPDTPGFVVNRLLFPYLFEAVELIERTGLDPKAIDACMTKGAGHPMGPLRLLDLVGIDVAVSIGEAIKAPVPAQLRDMLDAGALGKKAGRGFYNYD